MITANEINSILSQQMAAFGYSAQYAQAMSAQPGGQPMLPPFAPAPLDAWALQRSRQAAGLVPGAAEGGIQAMDWIAGLTPGIPMALAPSFAPFWAAGKGMAGVMGAPTAWGGFTGGMGALAGGNFSLGMRALAGGATAGLAMYGGIAATGAAANYLALDPFRQGLENYSSTAQMLSTMNQQQLLPSTRFAPLGQAGYLAGGLERMSESMGMGGNIGGLQSLMGQMAQAGQFRGVSTTEQLLSQFQRLHGQMQLLGTATGRPAVTTMPELLQLQQMGLGAVAGEAGMQIGGMGAAGGLGMGTMLAAGTRGAAIGRQMGIGRLGTRGRRGAAMMMELTAGIGAATQTGLLDEEVLADLTGQAGEAGVAAYADEVAGLGAAASQSRIGRMMAAAAMDPETGEIDPAAAAQLSAGGMGYRELRQRAGRNVRRAGRGRFRRLERGLRAELMEQVGPVGMATAASDIMGGMTTGMDPDMASLMMERYTGMGAEQLQVLERLGDAGPQIGARLRTLGRQEVERAFQEQQYNAATDIPQMISAAVDKMTEPVRAPIRRAARRLQESIHQTIRGTVEDMVGIHQVHIPRMYDEAIGAAMGGVATPAQQDLLQGMGGAGPGVQITPAEGGGVPGALVGPGLYLGGMGAGALGTGAFGLAGKAFGYAREMGTLGAAATGAAGRGAPLLARGWAAGQGLGFGGRAFAGGVGGLAAGAGGIGLKALGGAARFAGVVGTAYSAADLVREVSSIWRVTPGAEGTEALGRAMVSMGAAQWGMATVGEPEKFGDKSMTRFVPLQVGGAAGGDWGNMFRPGAWGGTTPSQWVTTEAEAEAFGTRLAGLAAGGAPELAEAGISLDAPTRLAMRRVWDQSGTTLQHNVRQAAEQQDFSLAARQVLGVVHGRGGSMATAVEQARRAGTWAQVALAQQITGGALFTGADINAMSRGGRDEKADFSAAVRGAMGRVTGAHDVIARGAWADVRGNIFRDMAQAPGVAFTWGNEGTTYSGGSYGLGASGLETLVGEEAAAALVNPESQHLETLAMGGKREKFREMGKAFAWSTDLTERVYDAFKGGNAQIRQTYSLWNRDKRTKEIREWATDAAGGLAEGSDLGDYVTGFGSAALTQEMRTVYGGIAHGQGLNVSGAVAAFADLSTKQQALVFQRVSQDEHYAHLSEAFGTYMGKSQRLGKFKGRKGSIGLLGGMQGLLAGTPMEDALLLHEKELRSGKMTGQFLDRIADAAGDDVTGETIVQALRGATTKDKQGRAVFVGEKALEDVVQKMSSISAKGGTTGISGVKTYGDPQGFAAALGFLTGEIRKKAEEIAGMTLAK